jgi:hypothetical protein
MTEPIDPQTADTWAEYASNLKLLQKRSGMSYRMLADISRSTSHPISMVTFASVLNGKIKPRRNTLIAVVEALKRAGKESDASDIDVGDWMAVYDRIAPDSPHGSGVQSNVFQSGKDYPYLGEEGLVLGAYNVINYSAVGSDQEVASRIGSSGHKTEYLESLETELTGVAKSARRRLVAYRLLRFAALAASAVTPAAALLNAAPWATAGIGTVAFLSEGSIQLTRLNDRAVLDTKRVQALSRQFRMYRTRVADYSAGDPFELLVQRIEQIREENDAEGLNVVQQSFGAHVRQDESIPRSSAD